MIWDKMGYHECRAFPRYDNGKAHDSILEIGVIIHYDAHKPKLDFCMCYYVGHIASDDLLTDNIDKIERNASTECPLHYTWKQMEAKIGPAIEYALEKRNKEEKKHELDKIKTETVTYTDKEETYIPSKKWTWKQLEAIKKNYFLKVRKITYQYKNSGFYRMNYETNSGYSFDEKCLHCPIHLKLDVVPFACREECQLKKEQAFTKEGILK
jgi:hypothetical protein